MIHFLKVLYIISEEILRQTISANPKTLVLKTFQTKNCYKDNNAYAQYYILNEIHKTFINNFREYHFPSLINNNINFLVKLTTTNKFKGRPRRLSHEEPNEKVYSLTVVAYTKGLLNFQIKFADIKMLTDIIMVT